MHSQEHLSSEYATGRDIPEQLPAPRLAKRFGWTLLGSPLGRSLALHVCQMMSHKLETARGVPTLQSRNGVVRLWHIEQFADISWSPKQPWTLDDGVELDPNDPVLEFHIAGERFIELTRATHWRKVIAEEFHSLVPTLQPRGEAALVGSTILRRQVAQFGASLRELPPGIHRSLDTFYRRLILLAFHPGGARRVMVERQAVAEAAISLQEFCRRYRTDAPPR